MTPALRSWLRGKSAEGVDQAIQVLPPVLFGDGDQEAVAEAGVDAAEIQPGNDALAFEGSANASSAAAAHPHAQLVEVRRACEARRVAGEGKDALVQVRRLREAALAHGDETALPEQRGADGERERQQPLVRADVAGRALAADVLLPRGEREHVAALPAVIHRFAADTAV